jgi:hypothetical protein
MLWQTGIRPEDPWLEIKDAIAIQAAVTGAYPYPTKNIHYYMGLPIYRFRYIGLN